MLAIISAFLTCAVPSTASQPLPVTPGTIVPGCPINMYYDENCQPILRTEDGQLLTLQPGQTRTLSDGKGNDLTFSYDPKTSTLNIKCSCGSTVPARIGVAGHLFTIKPCEEKEFLLLSGKKAAEYTSSAPETASAGSPIPGTIAPDGVDSKDLASGLIDPPASPTLPNEIAVGLNADGSLSVYTQGNKAIAVIDSTPFDLGGDVNGIVDYDPLAGMITIQNSCDSKKPLIVQILGAKFTLEPCKEKSILLSTATEGDPVPGTPGSDGFENPDEGREPVSPVTP